MSQAKNSTRSAGVSKAAAGRGRQPPKTVSGRWVLAAGAVAVGAATLCLWGALCLIYWQGSWQLLYHPQAKIAQAPSAVGLAYDAIDFAVTESGQPQLHGWWISAAPKSRFTAIYLHGADGNIGDTIGELALLHAAGLNVLAFDYRGYGESRFVRPSELHWREDAESAIQFLTNTRHIPAGSIVLVGSGLGANLALEIAAGRPELAGVVADDPVGAPENILFEDPRSRLVPAHWLIGDRWDLDAAAGGLRIPSLWFFAPAKPKTQAIGVDEYDKLSARKMRVWLTDARDRSADYGVALSRWLDELDAAAKTP